MKIRILLQAVGEDADFGAEEVVTFEKRTAGVEDLGLSLAEGKTLLAAVQRWTIERQASARVANHRRCGACAKRLRSKGG